MINAARIRPVLPSDLNHQRSGDGGIPVADQTHSFTASLSSAARRLFSAMRGSEPAKPLPVQPQRVRSLTTKQVSALKLPLEPSAAAVAVRHEERARMSAVFASEHVKGREQLAVFFLTETDIPAAKIVSKLPSFTGAAAGDAMLAALAGTKTPDIGAGAEPKGNTSKAYEDASRRRSFDQLGRAEKQ